MFVNKDIINIVKDSVGRFPIELIPIRAHYSNTGLFLPPINFLPPDGLYPAEHNFLYFLTDVKLSIIMTNLTAGCPLLAFYITYPYIHKDGSYALPLNFFASTAAGITVANNIYYQCDNILVAGLAFNGYNIAAGNPGANVNHCCTATGFKIIL